MKVLSSQFSVLSFCVLTAVLSAAEPPVAHPPLDHYAPLWERSIFTSRDLPSPDAPTGPVFTDTLSLAGTYEIDGQFVAIIMDRSTTQFSEARIGSENEAGIKIRKVQPGATMDKTKVQLQKGDQAGWVSASEEAPPAETVAPAIPTRPAPAASPAPLTSPLLPPLQPEPARLPDITPAPMPTAAAPAPDNDVPLPPN
jgi:hypothetical protein